MAKKSRRARSTPRLTSAQLVGAGEGQTGVRAEAGARRIGPTEAPRARLVHEDYSHVIGDLKRIALVAGSLLAIMVVLAIVLPYVVR